jgi:pilus assembly protein Flp/PilA
MRGRHFFRKLLQDCSGATAIEYGLIVALVVIAIMGSISSVADENTGLWAIVTSNVTANMNGS